MPLVLVRPLDFENEKTVINIENLQIPYPQFVRQGIGIRCLINRIFSPDGSKITAHPRVIRVFSIIKPQSYSTPKLDLSSYALPEGIPKGYHIELLIVNFVYEETKQGEGKLTMEFPIYPNETGIDAPTSIPYEIRTQIEKEIDDLRKVGESFETIGFLYQTGLYEIGSDLTEGLLRVERSDHEGAIKFFRKVVEGLRQLIQKRTIGTEKRTEEIGRFLGAAFSLMSNFGEHTGTHGWIDEAVLSAEIAVAISRYILKALKK